MFINSGIPALPSHSRSNKDGNDRVFQFWFLLCQLNEQFCDQSHMAKTVCGTPAIQLVTLEEEGGGGKRGGGEECAAHILSLCKLCTEPSTSNEETVVLHYTTRVERGRVLQYTSLSEGETEDCISTITTQSHKQNVINQFRSMSQATPTELTLNFLYSVIV